jgi:hypothetical protein
MKRKFPPHFRQKKEKLVLQSRCSKDRFYTWKELKDYLDTLNEVQLGQPAQILPNSSCLDKPVLLLPLIGAGTVEEMCSVDGKVLTETHAIQDWEHHNEQVVALSDGAPFDEEGNSEFEMVEDGMIGNKTKKLYPHITRKPCEPTTKASRTPGFNSQMGFNDQQLMDQQEELCQKWEKGTISGEERKTLEGIQAELYRRIYQLEPRKKKNVPSKDK